MGGVCNTHGRIRNAYRILVSEVHGKILLERLRNIFSCNIKLDFIETGQECED
jgi:hypothetical protein